MKEKKNLNYNLSIKDNVSGEVIFSAGTDTFIFAMFDDKKAGTEIISRMDDKIKYCINTLHANVKGIMNVINMLGKNEAEREEIFKRVFDIDVDFCAGGMH